MSGSLAGPGGTEPVPGIPMVRVLDERGEEVLRGWYVRFAARQVCPMGDRLRPEDVRHLVLHESFEDWNMPTRLVPTEITPPHRIVPVEIPPAGLVRCRECESAMLFCDGSAKCCRRWPLAYDEDCRKVTVVSVDVDPDGFCSLARRRDG